MNKNVLFITIDECKSNVLSCYGNVYNMSPKIDAFAKDSALFENYFTVFPKCTPARASLMTGRYAHTEGHRTLPKFEVDKTEKNLIHMFKNAGYKTAMIGKNHTVVPEQIDDFFDFHRVEGALEGITFPGKREDYETDDELFRAFYRGKFNTDIKNIKDTVASKAAAEYIIEDHGAPFFLLVNLSLPHPPYADISPYIEKIRRQNPKLPHIPDLKNVSPVMQKYREVYDLENMTPEKWRRVVEAYYCYVGYIDDCVGMMLDSLKKSGKYEDTIVVFMSDHGDFAGEQGCVEKWDTLFHECLIRCPFIVRVPGMAPGRYKALCDTVDIAPTIAELCGLEELCHMHGESLVPVLEGKTDFHKECVFSEGGVERRTVENKTVDPDEQPDRPKNYYWKQKLLKKYGFTLYRAKMVRDERYKYIFREDGTCELYDLFEDIYEINNLAGKEQMRCVEKKMLRRLLLWEIRTETDRPEIEELSS